MPENLDHFFRCVEKPDGCHFQVAIVKWEGPHTPSLDWTTVRRWKREPTEERLQKARAADLHEFLFGSERRSLEPYRAVLHEFDGSCCFYCERKLVRNAVGRSTVQAEGMGRGGGVDTSASVQVYTPPACRDGVERWGTFLTS